jgi:hypothetical protein
LTFPHKVWHKAAKLLGQLAKALQRLRAGQPWQRFKVRWGLEGLVRSLEVMYGTNGWHPHVHEIWLVKKGANAMEIQKDILERWKSACRRAGLLKSEQLQDFELRAVDVRGNISSSDYLLKQDDSRYWGADREITKASTKAGRSKGVHPFGLLARAGEGDRRAGRLYLAYCIAFKGRRQLLWSPGLKARVGVLDLTDEAIAEESREAADLLGSLSDADWQKVRAANVRAQVLHAAERGGWAAVQMLLLSLAQAFVLVRPADATVRA